MAKTDLPEALRQEYDAIMAADVDERDEAALFAINERVDLLKAAMYPAGFVWVLGWGDDYDGEPCRIEEARFGWAWLESGRSLTERVGETWWTGFGPHRQVVPAGTLITAGSTGLYEIVRVP